MPDDLVRMIRIGFAYCEPPSSHKQKSAATVISLQAAQRKQPIQHFQGAGEAGASGQGAKLLAGLGGAHESTEYDAARGRDGGAA